MVTLFTQNLISPINMLLDATEKIQYGDLSIRVTENQAEDDELLVLIKAFNTMITQLENQKKDLVHAQRVLALSDAARMVAHEIKNPLTPIQLAINMLDKLFAKEVQDKEKFNKYIQIVLKHVRDIDSIVYEFITFAKLSNSDMELVNIIEFLSEFVNSRNLLGRSQYFFISDIKSLNFKCDPRQIMQVMINLVNNSEDSITEKNIKGMIKICAKVSNNKLEISVQDNGIGFTDEALEKLKTHYFTNKISGTGLGIAVVKKVVLEHSGEVVISNIKDGAEVKLLFKNVN